MPQQPDSIILNANVLTMDSAGPTGQAVAVAGDRILAVGSNDEIRSLAGPDTREIDGQGMTLLPGFIDSHIHLLSLARTTQELDCRPDRASSVAAIAHRSSNGPASYRRANGSGATGTTTWPWTSRAIRLGTTWTRFRPAIRCGWTTAPATPWC